MKCVKCRTEFDSHVTGACPNCGTNQGNISFKTIDLDPEVKDIENADAILRVFSRIFLTLSILGAIICFILMAYQGFHVFTALISSIAIACLGIIIWTISNVLVNISCNIRKIANK